MKEAGELIVCLTAYDEPGGSMAEEAGVDVVLVGDSAATTVHGHPTTLPITLEETLTHVRAVAKGVERALLVADLPFGSYGAGVAQAVESACELAKAGAQAVKFEGPLLEEVRAVVRIGLPVMGHLGMTPQSVNEFGGHKVQGRDGGEDILRAAKELEEAGAFAIVLELVPAELGRRISQEVKVPTIGIGAGPWCDGQIQVFHDVLGLGTRSFKHAKVYLEGRRLITEALAKYVAETRKGEFPTEENSF
ncbi:MAG: 3-methyl-2-oxobutanoate hydroxymethyltransferase [Fimbriimonadaceae bacterium]|nr:3-methyl-2-oxobutanoate hydroxymethyltransferase [Fimbriimonadaceae bacterium]QYK55402.1 MAG: 3-methyl-2-oxobutanoate hydroxymethyltransferase [Fimbriimonadaceae bacterium]